MNRLENGQGRTLVSTQNPVAGTYFQINPELTNTLKKLFDVTIADLNRLPPDIRSIDVISALEPLAIVYNYHRHDIDTLESLAVERLTLIFRLYVIEMIYGMPLADVESLKTKDMIGAVYKNIRNLLSFGVSRGEFDSLDPSIRLLFLKYLEAIFPHVSRAEELLKFQSPFPSRKEILEFAFKLFYLEQAQFSLAQLKGIKQFWQQPLEKAYTTLAYFSACGLSVDDIRKLSGHITFEELLIGFNEINPLVPHAQNLLAFTGPFHDLTTVKKLRTLELAVILKKLSDRQIDWRILQKPDRTHIETIYRCYQNLMSVEVFFMGQVLPIDEDLTGLILSEQNPFELLAQSSAYPFEASSNERIKTARKIALVRDCGLGSMIQDAGNTDLLNSLTISIKRLQEQGFHPHVIHSLPLEFDRSVLLTNVENILSFLPEIQRILGTSDPITLTYCYCLFVYFRTPTQTPTIFFPFTVQDWDKAFLKDQERKHFIENIHQVLDCFPQLLYQIGLTFEGYVKCLCLPTDESSPSKAPFGPFLLEKTYKYFVLGQNKLLPHDVYKNNHLDLAYYISVLNDLYASASI